MALELEKDKLQTLRQQAYEELMSIDANIPAEKIILNDLTMDSQFNLAAPRPCVVGWATGGVNYVHNCRDCHKFSIDLWSEQKNHPSVRSFTSYMELNPQPTKRFLNLVLDFVKHYKDAKHSK